MADEDDRDDRRAATEHDRLGAGRSSDHDLSGHPRMDRTVVTVIRDIEGVREHLIGVEHRRLDFALQAHALCGISSWLRVTVVRERGPRRREAEVVHHYLFAVDGCPCLSSSSEVGDPDEAKAARVSAARCAAARRAALQRAPPSTYQGARPACATGPVAIDAPRPFVIHVSLSFTST